MSPIEEIKSRLDIIEVIGGYMKLQRAGINFKAACPFHGEKTASFFVSPAKQIWHCFGCGRGGDIFKFVMEIEGHDFSETLRLLAERAGVVLKRENPHLRSERNRLYEIHEIATHYYRQTLEATAEVREYLAKRGATDETLKEFQVGFAPKRWDFLFRAMREKGFRQDEIAKAGLIVEHPERRLWYDRFRSRIMFPIHDASGRIVGFGGRVFGEDATDNVNAAKYVNTPSTSIYDKSRILYGFDKAKQEIRRANTAVIVEGYMDCMMSHQGGVRNAVAVSGTALTPSQLVMLKRLCNILVCSFDRDAAGETATRRSLSLAIEHGFARKIAVIPSGKDPADAVLENPLQWRAAVEEAQPVVEFFFQKTFKECNAMTAEGKKEISQMLLPYIAELSDTIEQAHWVAVLAERLRVREETVWTELQKTKQEREISTTIQSPSGAIAPHTVKSRRELLEERLLALLAHLPDAEHVEQTYIIFSSTLNKNLYELLSEKKSNLVLNPSEKEALDIFRFKGELLQEMIPDMREELSFCVRELERICIKEAMATINDRIREKESSGRPDHIGSLVEEIQTLSRRLGTIE